MSKVLVAIDGSEHSRAALGAAAALFGADGDYVLVSVVPPWSSGVYEDLSVGGASGGSSPGVMTHGTSTETTPFAPTADGVSDTSEAYDYYLDAQRRAASAAGVSVEHEVVEATNRKRRIGRAICELADERGVDVVVIGSHGASHAGEVLLGSVSQYVLHHAACPVLVVRPT